MNQRERVIEYMREHGSITPLEAFEKLGCMRLAAQIHRLRTLDGIKICAEQQEAKNRFGENVRYTKYSISTTEQ